MKNKEGLISQKVHRLSGLSSRARARNSVFVLQPCSVVKKKKPQAPRFPRSADPFYPWSSAYSLDSMTMIVSTLVVSVTISDCLVGRIYCP